MSGNTSPHGYRNAPPPAANMSQAPPPSSYANPYAGQPVPSEAPPGYQTSLNMPPAYHPYPSQGQNLPMTGYSHPPNQGGYNTGYGGGPNYPPPPQAAYPQDQYRDDDVHVNIVPKQEGQEGQDFSDWSTPSFSDKAIRRAFIRKVYLILFAQLLVTFGFVCFFRFHEPTMVWVQQNNWFYWVSYGVFVVTYITLACCPSVRRSYPANFIGLAIFTLALSYMAATITSFYETSIVLIAVGITAVVCLSITIFAIQTRIDFTMCSGLIFALSMVLLLFGISCILVYSFLGYNYILNCVYGGVAALVFSLFLTYDTQMLIGGRKYQLSPEEYIFGALQLYLDIVNLFLIILTLFGNKN